MVKPDFWQDPIALRISRLATPADAREYLNSRKNMKYAFGIPLDQAAERYRFSAGLGLYIIRHSPR